MTFMSFICDSALIDPKTLVYKIYHAGAEVFATYENIDEDYFRLNVYPLGTVICNENVLKVADVVRDYLFDE